MKRSLYSFEMDQGFSIRYSRSRLSRQYFSWRAGNRYRPRHQQILGSSNASAAPSAPGRNAAHPAAREVFGVAGEQARARNRFEQVVDPLDESN